LKELVTIIAKIISFVNEEERGFRLLLVVQALRKVEREPTTLRKLRRSGKMKDEKQQAKLLNIF